MSDYDTPAKSLYSCAATGHTKWPSHYNNCPECGSIKQKFSKLCKPCREKVKKSPRVSSYIPDNTTFPFIHLTRGQVAIVDYMEYESLNQVKWSALWNPRTKSFYAVRNSPTVNGKRGIIWMHREILGLKYGDPREGDHALHNTLDNRRFVDGKENLRIASDVEQVRNHRKRKDNKSGFTGVFQRKDKGGAWEANIHINGKQKYLGSRNTAKAAYLELYVPAAIKYYGKFASGHLFEEIAA